jgi:hypothetical protein
MTTWMNQNRLAVHGGILGLTIIIAASILLIGYDSSQPAPPEIAIGEPSPNTFSATRSTSDFPDPEETERQRTLAENNVPAPYDIDSADSQRAINNINALYADLDQGAFEDVEEPEVTTVPDVENLSVTDAEVLAAESNLFVSVTRTIDTSLEERDGLVAIQFPPEATEVVEGSNIDVVVYVWEQSSTTTVPPTTTTTIPPDETGARRDVTDQIIDLAQNHAVLGQEILTDFVLLHEKDLDRIEAGEPSVFPDMQSTSIGWAQEELTDGIRDSELNDLRQKYLLPATRPPMFISGIPEEDVDTTHTAIATLVGQRLETNERVDQVQWEQDKQAARDAVPQQTVSYAAGETIAREGEILTSVQVAAINELELYDPEVVIVAPGWALALAGAIAILLFAFLLYRIVPQYLERTRDIVLLAIILVLAAIIAKVPSLVVSADNHSIGYVMPAVAIGVMTAILFDQRTALLMAIPMAGFAAIATTDITFTVFAGVTAAIPVAFVSKVSTRSQLRLSVLSSAILVVPVAMSLEYLFYYGADNASPWEAALWAFVGAVIGGFLAQGIVSFLENAFGVTTTMSLLDLLDRNHPALQELEVKAPGTFNHSMLVGSLAGRAARSVDADPLLAQAAAWYHDLGKTENPQYFVENQLGYNPHDELEPVQSAEIIRGHVTDGLVLANQFKIPEAVADGIRMHHGTSLMRYFYHKALTQDPDVDPELFRHHGAKPRSKEMAIVMVSDATEAAARAYAQQGQPTEIGLSKLVDDIVSEKLDDGQFDDSSITFGDLTVIKREIVAGLSAYYHARVEYPDFPTTETEPVIEGGGPAMSADEAQATDTAEPTEVP